MQNQELTTSTVLTPYADRHPVALPLYAMTGDGSEARVLLAGVDTIYFSFMFEVSDAIWERLEQSQEEAKDYDMTGEKAYIPDWLGVVLAPTGARGGYRFRIEHPDFTIKLIKGVPNRPGIYVEMRAFGLHTHPGGVLGACEAACGFIRAVLLCDGNSVDMARLVNLDTALCSRLDLHCDWQGGWQPTYTTGEDRLFIKPSRTKWKPEMDGNRCTGYRFGSGKVQARIYNKTLQTQLTHCDWYRELVAQHNPQGYDPALPVWRLEFQLLRDGVKGFKLYCTPEVTDPDDVVQAELDREDLPHIGTVRKALHWAGGVWQYLTHRWLRLVEPGDDANRARWDLHPTWRAMQAGFAPVIQGAPLADEKAQLVRKARHTGYERFPHRIEVGVLAMVDAHDTMPATTAHAWLAHLAHCADIAAQRQERLLQETGQAEAISRGMDCNGGPKYQKATLKAVLDDVLGLFTSAGVAKLEMREVGTVADLVCEVIDDLEAVTKEKGGLGQLLYEKRCKLYKVGSRQAYQGIQAA